MNLNDETVRLKRANAIVEQMANDNGVLALSHENIAIDGLIIFGNVIKSVSNSGNNVAAKFHTVLLDGNDIGDEGCKIVVNSMIPFLTSMKVLSLANNTISADGAKILCNALKGHKNITCLDLGVNEIGNDTSMFLDLVRATPSINTLILKSDEMGNEAVAPFVELIKMTKLVVLDLENNDIDDVGAEMLANALKFSKTMEILNLRSNEIGEIGEKSLKAVFVNHPSLKEVNLSGNRFLNNNIQIVKKN